MSKKQQPSVSLLRQALVIAERIQQLEGELAAILKQDVEVESSPTVSGDVKVGKRGRGPGKRKKPKFSAAARASIAAAQRARWAKIKKEKGEKTAPVVKKTKKRKKPKFSAEARESIAAAQRARWAKIRKAKGV
ncbi:MAG: hypothetical protein K8R87_05695 [Verrucomicrobia bacterium]|nr:hypothetical protein [Verrucomicrobiota bacterium]